jgi:hypothetical protein
MGPVGFGRVIVVGSCASRAFKISINRGTSLHREWDLKPVAVLGVHSSKKECFP